MAPQGRIGEVKGPTVAKNSDSTLFFIKIMRGGGQWSLIKIQKEHLKLTFDKYHIYILGVGYTAHNYFLDIQIYTCTLLN